jgi:predicted metal-dependent HD superfamily phosphohydrolase
MLLNELWFSHCVDHKIQTNRAAFWIDRILSAYSEPQRAYHTLAHIERMIHLFNQHQSIIKKKDQVFLAIVFHDIIYDPKSKENEVQSIELFREFARSDYSKKFIDCVSGMIESTINHQDSLQDADALLFLDLDLEILSSSKLDYQNYANDIRKEYQFVTDYNLQRIKVLQSFLNRSRLYFSPTFAHLESNARMNIENEIKYLAKYR